MLRFNPVSFSGRHPCNQRFALGRRFAAVAANDLPPPCYLHLPDEDLACFSNHSAIRASNCSNKKTVLANPAAHMQLRVAAGGGNSVSNIFHERHHKRISAQNQG